METDKSGYVMELTLGNIKIKICDDCCNASDREVGEMLARIAGIFMQVRMGQAQKDDIN